MSEATEYLIRNITKTYEIHNAIRRMETEVFEKVDINIRESFSSWVEGNWIAPEIENLHEDYCINIIREDWSFQKENDDIKSYIWTYLQFNGDDPIWKFFGFSDTEKNNSVKITLWLSEEFKQLQNYQNLIEKFDNLNKTLLIDSGFNCMGGKANRYYEMDVLFNNEDILKGIKDDDWDDFNKNLIYAWKIFEKIEWDFLRREIEKHRKIMST